MSLFPSPQATEELPEFPIVTRTYYVEFKFLEDFLHGGEKEELKDEGKEEAEEKEKEAAVSFNIQLPSVYKLQTFK